MAVLKNDRDKVMWFKMDIIGSKGKRGERGKVTENIVKAVTELIVESKF